MTKDFYIIAHNIRSLHNVGTMFRTADALGISRLYLTGYSGCPPRAEISKVALGAENIVPWEYHKNIAVLLKKLRQDKVKIIILEKTKSAVHYLKFKPKFWL